MPLLSERRLRPLRLLLPPADGGGLACCGDGCVSGTSPNSLLRALSAFSLSALSCWARLLSALLLSMGVAGDCVVLLP